MERPILGIDSVLIIYLLEGNTEYLPTVTHLFQTIERGHYQGVLSVIGLIEILTGPKKLKRPDIANHYRNLLSHFPNLTIAGINERVVESASDLRAQYAIQTADAIHLATAIAFGASKFLTNDQALKKITEIPVELITELSINSEA